MPQQRDFSDRERFRLLGRKMLDKPDDADRHELRVLAGCALTGTEPVQGAVADMLHVCEPNAERFGRLLERPEVVAHLPAYVHQAFQALVQSGERYWLNDAETQVLIAENERFQRINALEEMVGETFRRAENNEEGRWWSLTEVSDKLKDRYRNREVQNIALSTLGQVMNYPRFRFDSKRRSQGMIYRLVEQ